MMLVAFMLLQNITLGLYFATWRRVRAVKKPVLFVDDKQWYKFKDILNISTSVQDVVWDFIHPLNATVEVREGAF